MFDFLKKNSTNQTITLKLSGLHCASCSLNIDEALEELEGVIRASTNYARQESVINYDQDKVKIGALKKAIESAGYQVL